MAVTSHLARDVFRSLLGCLPFGWEHLRTASRGCGKVWYDRISPMNWWTTFNLTSQVLVSWRLEWISRAGSINCFGTLPRAIWAWFQIMRAVYKIEVQVRVPPGASTFFAHSHCSPIAVRRYRSSSSSSHVHWQLDRMLGMGSF